MVQNPPSRDDGDNGAGSAGHFIYGMVPACAAAGAIRDDERRRIAREIHDEFGQHLLVLRMDLQALKQRLARIRHDRLIDPLLQQLDAASTSLRALVRGLLPAAVAPGLRAALEWQCRELMQRSGIQCTLDWQAGDVPVPECQTAALYRILQESLINVQRHAGAGQVRVCVATERGLICMSISDDGRGFDPEVMDRSSAFGITGMRDRAAALGGTLCLRSAPGHGTCVSVSLPIENVVPGPAWPQCACCHRHPVSGGSPGQE